jgi:hypothetical protein
MRILVILLFISSLCAQSVIPEWVNQSTRLDDDFYYAVGHAVARTEDAAVERARQRALDSLAVYQQAEVNLKSSDGTSEVDDNGDQSYSVSYVRRSDLLSQVILRRVRQNRAHYYISDDKYYYYIEVKIHLNDLFPERPLQHAIAEGNTAAVKSLMMSYKASKNDVMYEMAIESLFDMSDNRRDHLKYIEYLYKKERFEDVVNAAMAVGIDDTNLTVRKAAQKIR